ncbi:MAG: 3-deoxy-7-phosphoheptulonate synthase [Bryobacteraceae bacterium]|nr:3-deoxy-7-phosphoheptulonate synthase [Bryobacteraceae bacterium]
MNRPRQPVCVRDFEIGGSDFIVMAGPCAVESEGQLMQTAEAVARAGGRVLRGGAFKPRTSPYDFQGLEVDGLKLLAKARALTGLAIVTEVMNDAQVELVAEYADILQIGSRSMENHVLLQRAGAAGRPVLLKRGMMATVEEYAAAAEILLARGCPGVILCERGLRTFGTATRNTCDIAAVPLLQELTGLPVILDPSHATGRRDLVPPVCRAAIGVGADGLLVETHPCPEKALSDGPQSLSLDEFERMMEELAPHIDLWRREAGRSTPRGNLVLEPCLAR